MNPMDHIQLSDIQRIYPATTVVELVFSDAQQALFVSAPDWEDETQSRVLRINPQTLSVEAEIALPVKGFGVALDDKRGLLYLTQGFNGSVAVVDICKNRLIATIPLMEEVVFEQRYQQEGISGARLAFLMRELARFGVSEGYPGSFANWCLIRSRSGCFCRDWGSGSTAFYLLSIPASAGWKKCCRAFAITS